MAKLYYSVLTTYGAQAFANAIANNRALHIQKMAVGDGNGKTVTPDSTRTALAREKYKANISAISRDPRNNKQVIFELTIPENIGGFWIREIGIFDDQNRLVAYANCPESFKPTLSSGSGKVQVIRMILLVSSSDSVTLTVDDSVIFATRGQLTPQKITATTRNSVDQTGHTHEIDKASTTQAGLVQLNNTLTSTSTTQALTAAQGKALKDELDALSVGGRNYLRNGRFENALAHWQNWGDCTRRVETAHNKKWVRLTTDNRELYRGIAQTVATFEPNTRYTLSFKAYSLRENAKLQLAVHQIPNNNPQVWSSPIAITDTPQTYVWSFTSADLEGKTGFHLMIGGQGGQPFDIYLTEIKFEKGTVGTDWSPAPEDTDTVLTGIRAEITAASRTVADLNDKVQSTHTIKAQAIAGSRTAIAGIALGATADNRTVESSVIVMADRFGVVKNAQDGTVKPMFNIVNNKVALHGDLVADGSITATKLAANSVTTGALQAGAILTEHLAAGQVSADKLAIGLGGNLLTNPIFANDAYHWIHSTYSARLVRRTVSQNPLPSWVNQQVYFPNENLFFMEIDTSASSISQGARIGYVGQTNIPLISGKTYIFSAYVAAHRCKAKLLVDLRDTNNGYPGGGGTSGYATSGFSRSIENASRIHIKFTVPTGRNINRGEFYILAEKDGAHQDAMLLVMRPMLEECYAHTREPSPWQNAGVTSIHGGSIATNSITAQQIAANTITGNEIVAGTVATKHLAARSVTSDLIMAGVELSAPIMRGGTVYAGHFDGGSININNRFKVNNQGQVEMRSAANNVGMVINNDQIIVYDQHGRIRVKMGRL